MHRVNQVVERFGIGGGEIERERSRNDSAILVFDPPLEIGKGSEFLRPKLLSQAVIIGLVVLEIIRIAAQHVQRANGVELERGLQIPLGGGVECLSNAAR